MIAGTLEVQMLASMARLADDMQKSKQIVGGAMKDIESAVASAKSALGALGIGLSAGYFVSLIKGTVDAIDHLHDLSKTIPITVEELAGLRVAAKQSGGDLDSITQSINKLSVEMGKSPEKFRALGVSAKDPLEAFKQFSDIFVKLEDPQQRAAVMAAALGKSWAGAAPLLAEGGKKIGEMVERGTKLSGVTTEMARQADELNDKWVLLGGTGGFLVRQVGPLLPLMNLLADDMLRAQESAHGLNSEFSPMLEVMKTLVVLGTNVAFVFKMIGGEIGVTMAKWAALARLDFKGANLIAKEWIADREKARAEQDEFDKKVMGAGLTGAASKGAAGANPADAADAAARAAKFLGGGDAAKQEQQIRDILHSVREAEDKRELDQIALQNANKLQAAQDFANQSLELEQMVQDETDRIQREANIGRFQAEKDFEMTKRGMMIGTWQLGAELLQALAGKSKLAAIAVIAINKGLAIAQVVQATAVATMRAFSDLGPIAGIPAAATIRTLGAVQIGLIAATGLLQAGNVGGGGASFGSPANPVSTTPGLASANRQEQLPPQIVLNLTVNGHILDTQEFTDTILVPALQDAIDNRDVTIIGANSRQAANLVAG